ncbi:MAG: endoglucanase [Acidimicrobiales bacterium]|nr:endoglucanase [Acidimicrobiales bacterium]
MTTMQSGRTARLLRLLAAPLLLALLLAPAVLSGARAHAATGVNNMTISDVSQLEGSSGTTNFVFTVTVSPAATDTETVHFATADGTATAPSDYAAQSGTLTFSPTDTTKTITVAVVGDTTAEPNENFTVNLSAPTNATITDPQGIGTIQNDDASLSVNDASRAEGNSNTANLGFIVSMPQSVTTTVTVHWATADGTAKAPGDYTASGGDLTFDPGQTSKPVSVPIVGDTVPEPDETFTVNLSAPTNATIADGQGVGTITNDESTVPTLSINDATTPEGDSGSHAAPFMVTLNPASTGPVTVDYATVDGTAHAPGDYTATSGTLTFAAGVTSQPINVPIMGDTNKEPDETFTVHLSNANNAATGRPDGLGMIQNDDGAVPTLIISDVTLAEGNSGTTNFVFTVALSPPSTQAVTVDYATADGSARAPSDYAAGTGTLTFNPGDTSKPITVPVNGDTFAEPNETFAVNLSNPNNAAIGDAQGVGAITNDDGTAPSLSINDVTHNEGNSGTTNYVFTVTLSAANPQAVTVDFATANGTATQPSDYAAQTGTLTFAPGETTKQVTVAVVGDTTAELNETFAVNLSNPSNTTISDAQGVGTITNDDAQPGGYTLDLFGGAHAYNGAAAAIGSPSWGRDTARGIAENKATGGGYVLDDWGGLHAINNAPAATGGPFWPGQDVARDVALIANSNQGYVLDDWGGIHAFNNAPVASGGPFFPGRDVARRIVLTGTGGYVLDNWGGLHPFAIGNGPAPAAVTNASYWFGQDVARGVVLTGGGGYTLDDWGGLHPFSIGNGTAPPTPTSNSYWPGQDVARGLALATGGGGYVIDDWGGLHSFSAGGVTPPAPTGGFYAPGFDAARGIT